MDRRRFVQNLSHAYEAAPGGGIIRSGSCARELFPHLTNREARTILSEGSALPVAIPSTMLRGVVHLARLEPRTARLSIEGARLLRNSGSARFIQPAVEFAERSFNLASTGVERGHPLWNVLAEWIFESPPKHDPGFFVPGREDPCDSWIIAEAVRFGTTEDPRGDAFIPQRTPIAADHVLLSALSASERRELEVVPVPRVVTRICLASRRGRPCGGIIENQQTRLVREHGLRKNVASCTSCGARYRYRQFEEEPGRWKANFQRWLPPIGWENAVLKRA